MKKLKIEEILPHINGVIVKEGASASFDKVITRKKQLKEEMLFFCIDRNLKKRNTEEPLPPCLVVTDRAKDVKALPGEATVVEVENIKEAYQQFLCFYRSLFSFPVIALTGTYGKTTTKEMIKHILTEDYNVKATKGNYNLFRSNASVLAGVEDETDFGIFEFGVGKEGHLEKCCRCFSPFSAIITGIGADHIERYGSQSKYMEEKAEILQGVGRNQVAILNADCMYSRKISRKQTNKTIIWFGIIEEADYKAHSVKYTKSGMEFLLTHGPYSIPVHIPGFGIHNVSNALAAIAATHAHGFNLEKAVKRLRTFKPLKRHLEITSGINGSTLIDDSWNTNSGSVKAALEVLNQISEDKKTIAVLGRISELGCEEEKEHKKIGRMVYKDQPSRVITIGDTASIIAKEAVQSGMDPKNITTCDDPEEALQLLRKIADADSLILIKTSMRDSFKPFIRALKKDDSNQ